MNLDNPWSVGRWVIARFSFRDCKCPTAEIFQGEAYQIHSWIILDGAPWVELEGITKKVFPIYIFATLRQDLDPKVWFRNEIKKYEG